MPPSPSLVSSGKVPRPPGHPPAIWTALVQASAWKSWVLVLQFAVIFLLLTAVLVVAKKEPDVVLVAEDGKSTYLNRELAGAALTRFLAEQRQRPSDVTAVHFAKDFLGRFLAVNSSTFDSAWPEALSMLSVDLRARMEKEAARQKLLETYRLSQVATRLDFEEVSVVEAFASTLHVRARARRLRQGVADGRAPMTDTVVVDVVEHVVPRSVAHPDGLEVAAVSVEEAPADSPADTPASPH